MSDSTEKAHVFVYCFPVLGSVIVNASSLDLVVLLMFDILQGPLGSLSGLLNPSVSALRSSPTKEKRDFFEYTTIYSWTFTSMLRGGTPLAPAFLSHIIVSMKFDFPNISSQISFRFANSLSSMLMKIAPSSASSFCSSFKRGYIMHSHLSWRVKSSPSLPTTSPSHFLIFGSLTLSL